MTGRDVNPDDEVDLLIDAWSRRLPGVDLTPLDVMSRVRRVALNLNRLRTQAFRSAGLVSWEFDVLALLRRADPPHELNPAQLITGTKVGSAAMTNRIENMLKRGLIERRPNPSDGRGVLVRPTREGEARVDAAMTALVGLEAAELTVLNAADRDALIRILGTLLR